MTQDIPTVIVAANEYFPPDIPKGPAFAAMTFLRGLFLENRNPVSGSWEAFRTGPNPRAVNLNEVRKGFELLVELGYLSLNAGTYSPTQKLLAQFVFANER